MTDDIKTAATKKEEDLRKKNGAEKKLAKSDTVYNWLKKRGKNVKKVVDAKTRKEMREV